MMIEKFLVEHANPQNSIMIQNHSITFLWPKNATELLIHIKKTLLIRVQKKTQDILERIFNWYCSGKYGKAFIQEKYLQTWSEIILELCRDLSQLMMRKTTWWNWQRNFKLCWKTRFWIYKFNSVPVDGNENQKSPTNEYPTMNLNWIIL
jgi:hypothetical protein